MKILSLLTQSKEDKDKKAAERAARALKRGQEALIDKLEAKKDDLTAQIDTLLDLDANKIKSNSDWNDKYHTAKVELTLIEAEIKVAKGTQSELFEDEKK